MVKVLPVQPTSATEGTRALVEAISQHRPLLQVSRLASTQHAAWNTYINRHPLGSLFHQTQWLRSVEDTFGHTPRHLIAHRDADVVGVFPLVQVNSILGGRMLISVPYAVAGGVLADDGEATDALWAEAVRIGHDIGANRIDLRSRRAEVDGVDRVDGYYGFQKTLPAQPSDVLGWLPRKARAAARNARVKHKLTVEFDRARVRDVWQLYCRNMRRLSSINYPYRFFTTLVDAFGEDAIVQVVRKDEKIVGGLISFRFGQTFMPYFVGCDERFNRCNTNHFIYMTAMECAVEMGCSVFDFGRTREDNEGSYNFKRFFGFEPVPLEYQRYVFAGKTASNLSPSNPRLQWVRRIWRHLPMRFCTTAGGHLSKHLPG